MTNPTRYVIQDPHGRTVASVNTPSRAQFYLGAFRAAWPGRKYTIVTAVAA